MSTAVAQRQQLNAIPALLMDEADLVKVLETSIYPGASLESIKFVVGYCRATQKDPMKRPVHIVPMSVKKAGARDQYEWRDVIMPGINDYRVDAARTGQHAGNAPAEFGPDITKTLSGTEVTFPEWCEFTVYRYVGGEARPFSSGKVRWIETYATAKRDTSAPNAMWKKRPYGQLEKCAEALALRRGFPEVGNQPTAEEMEGRVIDHGEFIDHETGQITDGKPAIQMPASKSKATAQQPAPPTEAAEATDQSPASAAPGSTDTEGPRVSPGQLKTIRATLSRSEGDESTLCTVLGVTTLEDLPMSRVNEAIQKASGK